jgi:microcystin-dependent protein
MSNPFVAEVRIFPFFFAPPGWAFCDGQLIPISQNTALFALLGTVYGGDGKSTFALPDLQGAAPRHPGQMAPGLSDTFLGQMGGSDSVTLLQSEIPVHTHSLQSSTSDANSNSPDGQLVASAVGVGMYAAPSNPLQQLNPTTLAVTGSSFPHNNLMPALVLNMCIAMQGVFPQRP